MKGSDSKAKSSDKKNTKADSGKFAKMDLNDTGEPLDYDSMKRKGKHWKSDELQAERKQVADLDKWETK